MHLMLLAGYHSAWVLDPNSRPSFCTALMFVVSLSISLNLITHPRFCPDLRVCCCFFQCILAVFQYLKMLQVIGPQERYAHTVDLLAVQIISFVSMGWLSSTLFAFTPSKSLALCDCKELGANFAPASPWTHPRQTGLFEQPRNPLYREERYFPASTFS